MSYSIGPNLSSSAALVGNQPLRGTWRRSATATAAEVFSGSLADTSLQQLFQKLDERLGRAYLVRGSAPTFTEDTVTLDLVTVAPSIMPAGLNASQLAALADELVTGLPLVNLNGRVRTPGEQQRAEQRDTAAATGQKVADSQELGTWFGQLGSTAKLIFAGVVVLAIVAGAIYFLPHTGGKKSE